MGVAPSRHPRPLGSRDFGTVNFDDLFDFSPEPLDSREAEVQRQNETSFLSSGFPGSAGSAGGDGDAFHQRVKQGDGGGWAGGGGGEGQQYSQSIGIPQGVIMKTEREDNWENTNSEDTLSKSLESATTARGRKGKAQDVKVKLERSRQSARECRARKKLRYQYVDDIISAREQANNRLRDELVRLVDMCHELDKGRVPEGFEEMLRQESLTQAGQAN